MPFHVYVDRTSDGVPYYVGMGDDTRVRLKRRNKHHGNVARKHGFVRLVVESHEARDEAARREVELIAELHTFVDDPLYNGVGCNYTKGGEGCACDEKTRKKMSETIKKGYAAGRIGWSKQHKGTYTINITAADRLRRQQQLAAYNRRVKPMLGKTHSEEHLQKMRKPHRCSICAVGGHTKTTCPKRPADAVNNVQVAQKNRYEHVRKTLVPPGST